MLQAILWGVIFIASGIGLVVYARKLVEWFGTMATAEKYLGSGGTYSALRIMGILSIIIGILVMTGFLDDALFSVVKLFGVER